MVSWPLYRFHDSKSDIRLSFTLSYIASSPILYIELTNIQYLLINADCI